jgi:hypothetical protein
MKSEIIIVGAGAIGRGYLPWVLSSEHHDLVFVDSDARIVSRMQETRQYRTYRVRNDELEPRTVEVRAAYSPSSFRIADHPNAAAAFLSVGPRNVAKAAELFRGTDIPLILCENEPNTVQDAKAVVGHDKVYFAVPDVITSNTAPAHLLKDDPLSITTEDGVLFAEAGITGLHAEVTYLSADELLHQQWAAKLYLHNTPHCIAAYLGALVGATYVHEAMAIPEVDAVVAGAMDEMLNWLKLRWDIPHDFLEWYAGKELRRFRSKLLYDPVARVAREPLRKLEMHGRLIGAAQMCLTLGIVPANVLTGITGALLFENVSDPDHHLILLRRSMPDDLFNSYILGLRPDEPLDLILREQIGPIIAKLETFPKVAR